MDNTNQQLKRIRKLQRQWDSSTVMTLEKLKTLDSIEFQNEDHGYLSYVAIHEPNRFYFFNTVSQRRLMEIVRNNSDSTDGLDMLCSAAEMEADTLLSKYNYTMPFDEIVIYHESLPSYYHKQTYDFKHYTIIKMLDRKANIISMERYMYGIMQEQSVAYAMDKPMGQPYFTCEMYATLKLGTTKESVKKMFNKTYFDKEKVKISPIFETVLKSADNNQNPDAPKVDLVFDYLNLVYSYYYMLENRQYKIKTTGSKSRRTVSSEPAASKPKPTRRTVSIGNAITIYTKSDDLVQNITHREHVYHVEEFTRRETICKLHKKDGTITEYKRKACVVRPKKVEKLATDYKIK